jgi:hypothetical protein
MQNERAPMATGANDGVGVWGRSDLMALAAVRYCLGRSSYIVGDCVDWLHQQWPRMQPSIQALIARDIDAEFARDDRARAEGYADTPLGMDMDRRQWERARQLWAPPPEDPMNAVRSMCG